MPQPMNMTSPPIGWLSALTTVLQVSSAPDISLDKGSIHHEEFSRVTSVRELADGSALAIDVLEQRIVHLTWDGQVATQVGRIGSGPEEYRGLYTLTPLGGDSSLAADGTLRRVLVLEGPRIVGVLPPDHAFVTYLGLDFSGGDAHSRVLAVRSAASAKGTSPLFADSTYVVLMHVRGTMADTVAALRGARARPQRMPTRGGGGGRIDIVMNPLLVPEQALLFPDGWIAIARAHPYRVDWISPMGTLSPGKSLPALAPVVDDEEKRAAFMRDGERSPAEAANLASTVEDWPAVVPPFTRGALLAAPNGQLVIRRMPTAREPQNRYDVVDRRGVLVARLALPPHERIAGFGRNTVYIVVIADDGVQRLRRHRWPPI